MNTPDDSPAWRQLAYGYAQKLQRFMRYASMLREEVITLRAELLRREAELRELKGME